MFRNRQRFVLETDLCSGVHEMSCFTCGPSNPLQSLGNDMVRFEGRLILVDQDPFMPHPNVGSDPLNCCVGHATLGDAESNPVFGSFVDDGLIRVNGRVPLHIGDFTQCRSTIISTD